MNFLIRYAQSDNSKNVNSKSHLIDVVKKNKNYKKKYTIHCYYYFFSQEINFRETRIQKILETNDKSVIRRVLSRRQTPSEAFLPTHC